MSHKFAAQLDEKLLEMTQLPKNLGIKNPKRRHLNDANYIGKNHRKLNKRIDNGRPWLN